MRDAGAKNRAGGGPTPEYDICCPNCQVRGDFMQEVNKVLQNCIDFCEFPHRCQGPDGKSEIIWETLGELQSHAQFHCPKFGCDICYREEFQHMTRAQLFDHIKNECPDVLIMCQICNREYTRAEFSQHQCIKDFYLEKLRACSEEVIENLADNLILHKRQREALGICKKPQCVERHRCCGKQQVQAMILQNSEAAAVKCFSCKNVVAGFEDSYSCAYCNESYSPACLGYCKFYDLDEMEQLLLKSKE